MVDDWYRRTTWDDAVAERFYKRLDRARHKGQYLRIQASMLSRIRPEVALELLDQYFQLPIELDRAQAHVHRATALLALNRLGDAVASYEAARAREAEFPNCLTQAYLELPYLIATRQIQERYDQAMTILEEHKEHLTFPLDYCHWHATRALISKARGATPEARSHARIALAAAAREHSGFRYHPSLGLVTDEYDDVVQTLEVYRDA